MSDDFVTMRHPDLPGQPIRVRANKTGPRLASGWEVAPDEEPAPAGDTEEPKAPKRSSNRRTDATDKKDEEAV
ncbi:MULTISPECIES: hypothetical protein [Actinomycetes]|uniref:Uncharacterized protein n=2 Tax=Actinomycetes TaxID=1760 RepID=A0ABU2AK77_9ACTN|nr:hypothetical protein [Glycomyces lechevalierae]MDR7336837.1 hypothetical protein [Glycomyces lechevalierae]